MNPEKAVSFAKERYRRSQGLEIQKIKDLNREASCPRRGVTTTSLKSVHSIRLDKLVCCSKCARRILLRDTAINLVTSNVVRPFIWLIPVFLPQIGKMLNTGHDQKTLDGAL